MYTWSIACIWIYFFINYKTQPTESAFWDCNCGSNWPTTVSDQMYSAIVHILHASSSVRCSGQWLMKSRKMYQICSEIPVKWYRYIIKEFIHLILFFVVYTCTKQYIKNVDFFFSDTELLSLQWITHVTKVYLFYGWTLKLNIVHEYWW